MPFEAITTVVMGDTDRTPEAADSPPASSNTAGQNLRKAAAYTYQAIARPGRDTLGVDKSQLSVKDGVVSGGGKSLSYGDSCKGQQLKLTIPVRAT